MAKFEVKTVATSSNGGRSFKSETIEAENSQEAIEIAKSRAQNRHPNDKISIDSIKKL